MAVFPFFVPMFHGANSFSPPQTKPGAQLDYNREEQAKWDDLIQAEKNYLLSLRAEVLNGTLPAGIPTDNLIQLLDYYLTYVGTKDEAFARVQIFEAFRKIALGGDLSKPYPLMLPNPLLSGIGADAVVWGKNKFTEQASKLASNPKDSLLGKFLLDAGPKWVKDNWKDSSSILLSTGKEREGQLWQAAQDLWIDLTSAGFTNVDSLSKSLKTFADKIGPIIATALASCMSCMLLAPIFSVVITAALKFVIDLIFTPMQRAKIAAERVKQFQTRIATPSYRMIHTWLNHYFWALRPYWISEYLKDQQHMPMAIGYANHLMNPAIEDMSKDWLSVDFYYNKGFMGPGARDDFNDWLSMRKTYQKMGYLADALKMGDDLGLPDAVTGKPMSMKVLEESFKNGRFSEIWYNFDGMWRPQPYGFADLTDVIRDAVSFYCSAYDQSYDINKWVKDPTRKQDAQDWLNNKGRWAFKAEQYPPVQQSITQNVNTNTGQNTAPEEEETPWLLYLLMAGVLGTGVWAGVKGIKRWKHRHDK